MTYTTKFSIALAMGLVALPAMAGNSVLDQLRQRVYDQSCLVVAEQIIAEDETLTYDQVRDRLQLRDCDCLTDQDSAGDQLKTRTRAGADNGQGAMSQARNGAGAN